MNLIVTDNASTKKLAKHLSAVSSAASLSELEALRSMKDAGVAGDTEATEERIAEARLYRYIGSIAAHGLAVLAGKVTDPQPLGVRLAFTVDNTLPAPAGYAVGSASEGVAHVVVNMAMHAAVSKADDQPMPLVLADTIVHELVHVAQDLAGYLCTDDVVYQAMDVAEMIHVSEDVNEAINRTADELYLARKRIAELEAELAAVQNKEDDT